MLNLDNVERERFSFSYAAALVAISAISLLLNVAVVRAQDTSPTLSAGEVADSFDTILRRAWESSSSWRVARARLEQARKGVEVAESGGSLSVSLLGSGGLTGSQSTANSSTTEQGTFPASVRVSARFPLIDGGRTKGGVDSAKASVESASAALRQVEERLLLSAALAYVQVLRDRAVSEVSRSNEHRLEEVLRAERTRAAAGERSRLDVARAQAALARARSDRVSADSSTNRSEVIFQRVVGSPPPPDMVAVDVNLALPKSLEEAQNRARDRSWSVRRAEHDVAAASANVRVHRAAYAPMVDLMASVSTGINQQQKNTRSSSVQISVNVTMDLWNDARSPRLESVRLGEFAARATLSSERDSIFSSATETWNAFQSALAGLDAAREEEQISQLSRELAEERQRAGVLSVLDILDAFQTELESRIRAENANLILQESRFRLAAVTGALDFESLGMDRDVLEEYVIQFIQETVVAEDE